MPSMVYMFFHTGIFFVSTINLQTQWKIVVFMLDIYHNKYNVW